MGTGTLGWKGPGLTTFPASMNPIKVLKNQITCEAFNMNFSLCHGRGCMEEGSRKQQKSFCGNGRSPRPSSPGHTCLCDTGSMLASALGSIGNSNVLPQVPSALFFKKKKLIYLSLAVLGLCYPVWAFSSCHEWGLLSSSSRRALGGAGSSNCGTPASLL